jgi:PKD repeat protein
LGGLGGGGGGGGSTGDSIGPAAAPCTVCNNPGFESGSGGGWSYDWGSDAQPGGLSATVCGAPHPQICVGGTGFTAPNHTIMTAGAFDPIAGGTILPVVPPFGGNKSLRLGDGNAVMGDGNGVGSMAARAKFTYRVQQSTANFTYRYAIVIEEPGAGFPAHLPNERPFFNAAVTDSAGNTISCGNLYVVAIPPITDFTEAADPKKTGRSDWYRGWSTVVLPLGAYIGQCVSIQFTTGDCGLGAHFGYAYIDASCDPAGAITVSPNACGGYLLAAPTNAHAYKWTNKAGGNTGIDGIDTNQTVNVNQAGTYVVNMSSLAGAACGIILEVTVGAPGPNPVSFVPFTGCSGSATQFTDTSTPSSPATGWAWDFNNDKLADAVIKNPTYTFPSSGTFPVTLTIYIGGCSATITQTVTVTKPTKPVVDPAGPFCVSAPPITLKTSISGGTWSGPGITNVSAGIFTPSAANIGNNQIIYATSADCPGKDTITIVIKGPAADAGRDIVICTGNTGNLGVPPTANIKYSWSPTTGLNSSTISNPTVTLTNNQSVTATYSYTVTATDTALNCAATDVVNVTVNPLPFVNAGPDQTICVGSTVTLNGSVSGATTSYTWSGGSGTFNPNNTSLNPVYTPNSFEISTGSVSLILTSNNLAPCPAATDQMVITINPVAIVNAGNDQTICIGSSANLAGSIGGSATTGTWSGGAGTFNPNNNDPNAAYTPSTTEGTAGGVTLTYTTDDPSGPCPAVTDQVKITINPLPTANAGPDQTICNGSAALAGSIGGSATSMIWSGGSGTFNPSNTSLNSNYTPSASEIAAGGVTISLTTNAAGACPPVTDQMAIKINPVAVVNAGPDQIICINSTTASNTVSLAGTFGGAATSGIWSGGSGTYSPNTSDPNAIYTLSGSETTNSNITLTYTANVPVGSPCPTVSDAMVISIDQVPTVNAGLDQTICSGSTVTLAGSIGGSATSATWSGGGGIYNPNNTSLNCVYTPTASEIALGSVALTLTTNDPAGPCTPANDQMIIIINPPALANVGSDQTICVGGTITLAGVYNGSASSGTWSGGAGTYSPNNTIANAIYTPSASENAAGTVTLTYTTNDPAGPCPAASAQMILTIDALPTVNAGTVQPVCSGANVTLNGSIGGSATSATWSGGTGTYSPDNTTLNATYTPSASEYSVGFVVLTLTTNDPAGPCPPASSNVTINFFPAPTVNFIVDDPDGCPVHCVKFTDLSTVSGGNSIVAWNWTFGDGGTSTLQSPSHCYSNTGKYDVSLSVTDNNSCTGTLKINTMITVYAFPVAEFYATPNPASTDNPAITFINQSSSDVTFWQWEFGDGDTIAGNNSKPTHTYPNTAATYQATLVVHNADFCYANVTHEITIQPVFSFFIPNAFTPHNGDGVDDFFFGKGVGIIQYDLWIFDRWGNMIFHGKDLNDKWDGKAYNLTEFGGNKEGKHIAQEDVFVWKVHLTDIFNNTHDYIGTVTLVK